MKKIALAAALSMAATTAFAGGMGGKYKEPVIEPAVVVEDVKSSSASGIIVSADAAAGCRCCRCFALSTAKQHVKNGGPWPAIFYFHL